MKKRMISFVFILSALVFFSCNGEPFDFGDGDEDVLPDTTDTQQDTDGQDVPPDGDVLPDGPDTTDVPVDVIDDDGEPSMCDPGTGDCNGDPSDGCETDTTSNPLHCGACGHDCLEGTCVGSLCQPVKLADPLGNPGTGVGNGFLALDDTCVYFAYKGTTVGGVAFVAKDGTGATCIACDQGHPRAITTDTASVYWADQGLNEVRKAPLGGGAVTTLISTGTVGTPVAVDPSHVYWWDSGSNSIMQADLDGSNSAVVASGQSNVMWIAAEGGFVFWTTQTQVMARDLSGGAATPLATGQDHPGSVEVDATHVYFKQGSTWGSETVRRVLRTGGTVEEIATGGAFAIALDATHVYASDNFGGRIWRVAKDGGTVEVLATGLTFPFDIAVDNEAVYWASETTAVVEKVAK
jgi:hypothetical protein